MADANFGFSGDNGRSAVLGNSSMPSPEELTPQFDALLDTMGVSDTERAELMRLTDARKWTLIQKDGARRVQLPVDWFIDQLTRHMSPELKTKKVDKKKILGLEATFDVLTKLESTLRTKAPGSASDSWIEEFCNHPHNGHIVLLNFIHDLPLSAAVKSTTPVLIRQSGEHQLVLKCMHAIMRHDYGFRKILDEENIMNTIAVSIQNEIPATRLAALEMLAMAAADVHDGGIVAMDAIHHLSNIAKESTRFLTIFDQLKDRSCPTKYKLAGMQLISNVVNFAPDLNMLVYWQMDLERAGVDEIITQFEGDKNQTLVSMAKAYKAKLVNCDDLVAAREENFRLFNQGSEEISALQETVKTLTGARDELRTDLKEMQLKSNDFQGMVSAYRKETERLNTKLEEASKIILEQNTMMQEHRQQLEQLEHEHMELRERASGAGLSNVGISSARPVAPTAALISALNTPDTDSPLAPPPPAPPLPAALGGDGQAKFAAPPPAPPLPPGMGGAPPAPPAPAPPPMPGSSFPPKAPPPPGSMAGKGMKRRIQPNVPLPMLNWVPLRKVDNTIFEVIDDENVLAEIDFREFEKMFRAKEAIELKLKTSSSKKKALVTVIESNRARNLVITYRRIGMDYAFLQETIMSTDLTELQPEHAELLLNYIPTDEETAALDKHSHHKDRMDEADRFMWEMLKVERYESRLRVMAYIGYFDEILLTAQPQVDAVVAASSSLMASDQFKKILEIVLAFGNYMNSAKRGAAYGFKLETFERLLDTRASEDRKITLLHYIAQVVTDQYPHCEHFYETIVQLEEAARVSLVTLQTDVSGLRKGIDLILYEREKQQANFVIYAFYTNAVQKVAKLGEQFLELKEQYTKVCVLFNEDPSQTEPFEFFGVFSKFVKNYKRCVKENHKRRNTPAVPKKVLKVITRDEFREKFSDLQVELPPHPLLGTTSKELGN